MALLDDLFGIGNGPMANPMDSAKNALLADLFKRLEANKSVPAVVTSESTPAPMPEMTVRDVTPRPIAGVPYAPPSAASQMPELPRAEAGQSPPAFAADTPGPAKFSPSVSDRMVAFGKALQGQDPGDLDRQAAVKNETLGFLMKRGLSEADGRALIANPALLQATLPSLVGSKSEWKLEKIDDGYGVSRNVWVNPRTMETKPFEMGNAGGQPAPTAAPAAPAPMPTAPGLPAPVQAPAIATPTAETAAPAPAAMPAMGTKAAEALPANATIGRAVPKAPEGYIHKAAPNGAGYLWDKTTGQPIFELKSEVESRAKIGEKRADMQLEADNQISGVKNVIADARKLSRSQSFDQALFLGRTTLDVGVGTPWGRLGGDVLAPVKQAARMYDPQNPAFSTFDELSAVQQRLNLLVARPLMKGQGQVTDGERKMISDAIGGLALSANAADYQFRLNSVERMIEDMNTGGKLKPATVYNARPTRDEISGVIDTKNNTFNTAGMEALAKKYNVDPMDMQNYIVEIDRNARGSKSNPPPADQPPQRPAFDTRAETKRLLEEQRARQARMAGAPAPAPAPEAPAPAQVGPKPDQNIALQQAQAAIAAGRDPAAVRARLRQWGYDLP